MRDRLRRIRTTRARAGSAPPGADAGPGSVGAGPVGARRLEQVALTADEAVVVAVLQCLVAARDVAAVTSPSSRPVKGDLLATMTAELRAAVSGPAAPAWGRDLAVGLGNELVRVRREALETAAARAGATITRRSRAVLVLVELHAFDPWPEGHPWAVAVRRRALDEAAGLLPGMSPGDPTAVRDEIEAVTRQMRRAHVRWGRVVAVGVVGVGLGAATMGAAAPFIGASLGAVSGLSGAAATSAGLAALGGGSVAAGGLGVAGGTAVLTGVGALTGLGAAAGGARAGRWAAHGDVALDALKADVLTRLVVLGEEHDEEKAKRVVEALQARLEDVTDGIARLGARIQRLTREKDALAAENAELRAENARLIEELIAERDQARIAETALTVAIERIPVNVPADVRTDRG